MAFGFGFNKQKVLSAAEKFVQQGKLQNAIVEYEKVLQHDANDLTVNNTIGDLYARNGDNSKAIDSFKQVGDAYAAQGFTVKSIAMYKKIAKLRPSLDTALKLAELYTQQGLFNDARAQYLQVAEDFLKNGDLGQAVRLFQKVLEMDPENVPMRVKLAEVYVRLGKKSEAWEIFAAAAEALRARGGLAGAEDVLKRMTALDPANSYVLLLRGKAALETGDAKQAIAYLQKASDIDSHPEGLRDLLKAYLQLGSLPKATPIAEKLLTVHNDPQGVFLLAQGCVELGQFHEAIEIYTRHADRLLAVDSATVLSALHALVAHVRDDAEALDSLLRLLNKSGETTHINEVTELLAHASVKNGDLTRARDLYQALSTAEPQNQLHAQNYRQMLDRLRPAGASPESSSAQGGPSAATRFGEAAPSAGLSATPSASAAIGAITAITAEEGAMIVEDLEASAPVVDQSYPDEIAIALRSAVTDADLFISYNLPAKAVAPLLGALPQAPRDVRLNQRLVALHNRFNSFAEAAVCCRTLEGVYRDAGHPEEAARYSELASRYEKSAPSSRPAERSSAAAAGAQAPQPAAWPTASATRSPAGSAPSNITASAFELPEMIVEAPSEMPEMAVELYSTDTASGDLASEWERSLALDTTSLHFPTADIPTIAANDTAVSSPDLVSVRAPHIAETTEEIRFYLDHGMADQAGVALEKLSSLTSDSNILDPLRAALAASSKPPAEPEVEIAEIDAHEIVASKTKAMSAGQIKIKEVLSDADRAVPVKAVFPVARTARAATSGEPAEFMVAAAALAAQESVPESYDAVPDDAAVEAVFQAGRTEAPRPQPAQAAPSPAMPTNGALAAIVADLETSLGDTFPAPATAPPINGAAVPNPVASANPVTAALAASQSKPSPPSGAIDLSEMFGELRQQLEDGAAPSDDDPETHYNLGVAFREMGLLDEAIAELQKVCAALDKGAPFAQPVQACTWLAQCFLDKGVPELAIRWYEKALNLPGIDNETRLAIDYELGSACESAKDRTAALRHFTSVYGANIDYRDVAERIQALKS